MSIERLGALTGFRATDAEVRALASAAQRETDNIYRNLDNLGIEIDSEGNGLTLSGGVLSMGLASAASAGAMSAADYALLHSLEDALVEAGGITSIERDNWNAAYSHSQSTGNPHLTKLSELDDVIVTTPAASQMLQYDGTDWVNVTDILGVGAFSGTTITGTDLTINLASTGIAVIGQVGVVSGLWLTNGGILSQASEFQFVTEGSKPFSWRTGGVFNTLGGGTERMALSTTGLSIRVKPTILYNSGGAAGSFPLLVIQDDYTAAGTASSGILLRRANAASRDWSIANWQGGFQIQYGNDLTDIGVGTTVLALADTGLTITGATTSTGIIQGLEFKAVNGGTTSRWSTGATGEFGINYNNGATGSFVFYGGGTAIAFSVGNTGTTLAVGGIGLTRAAGVVGDFSWNTGAIGSQVLRWIARVTSEAESGSNAGSNWTLNARSDAGAQLGEVLNVARSTGGLILGSFGVGGLSLKTNNVVRWYLNGSNGYLIPNADNTYDIGATGGYAVRSLYLGTSLFVGGFKIDPGFASDRMRLRPNAAGKSIFEMVPNTNVVGAKSQITLYTSDRTADGTNYSYLNIYADTTGLTFDFAAAGTGSQAASIAFDTASFTNVGTIGSGAITSTSTVRATPYFYADAAAAAHAGYFHRTGSSARWLVSKNQTAEGGANAGSDWEINRYDDAGAWIATALRIYRSSGQIAAYGNVFPAANDAYAIGVAGNGWLRVVVEHTSNKADGITLRQIGAGFGSPRVFFDNPTSWAGSGVALYQGGANNFSITYGATPLTGTGAAMATFTPTLLTLTGGITAGVNGAFTFFGSAAYAGNLALKIANTTTSQTALIAIGEDTGSLTPFYIQRFGSTHANAEQALIRNSANATLTLQTGNANMNFTVGGGVRATIAYTSGAFLLNNPNVLGGTLGNVQLLTEVQAESDTSQVYRRLWAYRDAAGTNWNYFRFHDGISVDSSYATPRTDTRVWMERDPYDAFFAWGHSAVEYMKLTATRLLMSGGTDVQFLVNGGGYLELGNTTAQVRLSNDAAVSTIQSVSNALNLGTVRADTAFEHIRFASVRSDGTTTFATLQDAATPTFGINVNTVFTDAKTLYSTTYSSGWTGTGWKVDYQSGEYVLEVDRAFIRGTLTIYELLLNQIRATNGSLFVSSAGRVDNVIVSTVGAEVIEIEDPDEDVTPALRVQPFAVGDLIIMQRADLSNIPGTIVKRIVRKVASINTGSVGNRITLTTVAGAPADTGTISSGDDFVRFGNDTTSLRQGIIYMTSDDNNAPFIRVEDGIASWADWKSDSKLKVLIGKLDGYTGLSGYGAMIRNSSGSQGIVFQSTPTVSKIALGNTPTSITLAGTETGFYVDGDGHMKVYHDANNYLRKNASGLDIKASVFTLVGGTTLYVNSATPIIALGATASSITVANTNAGVAMDGAGGFKAYGDANNYLRKSGTSLDVKSQTFSLATTNMTISSGSLAATAGKLYISGADLTVLAGSAVKISGATVGSLALGAATAILTGNGVWMDGNGYARVGSITTGALTEGYSWDGTTFLVRSTNLVLSATGIKIDSTVPSIGVGATAYNVGNGTWMGLVGGALQVFRVGEATGARLYFDTAYGLRIYTGTSNILLDASLGASTVTFAGWTANENYLWKLTSGTPGAAPVGGLVLDPGTKAFIAYGGASTKYVKMFYTSATDWGVLGTNDSGTTVFQLGYLNNIAGFIFTNTSISKGDASGSIYVASGLDIPAGDVVWLGKSADGSYAGLMVRRGSKYIAMIASTGLTYPYLQINDGTYTRVVVGDMGYNWNTAGGTYAGVGIKVFSNTGTLLFGNTADATVVIGGWTIATTQLSATNILLVSGAANTARLEVGTGSNIGGVNSANASGEIIFWGGATHANRATAPFRVTAAGSAVITGTLTSTTGTGQRTVITGTTVEFYTAGNVVAGVVYSLQDASPSANDWLTINANSGDYVALLALKGIAIAGQISDFSVSGLAMKVLLNGNNNGGVRILTGALDLDAQAATPTFSGSVSAYVKGSKFVLSYDDGGTRRYKYLDMAGTGVTWVHTTTAP